MSTVHPELFNHEMKSANAAQQDEFLLTSNRQKATGRIDYSDGYSKGGENNIFYGFGSGKYKEASVFDGCFSSNTRLYKLHGSLDRYWIGELVTCPDENGESFSVKVDGAYKVTPDFSQISGVKHFATETPDFLTGVETKKLYYRFTPYRLNASIKILNAQELCLLQATVSATRG